MSKHKKINPRRRPVNAYELQRAQDKAADAYVQISIYALLDCGASEDLIIQYAKKFRYTIEALNVGRLTAQDITRVLRDEYGAKVEF